MDILNNMKKIKFIFVSLFCCIFFASCYFDKKDQIYPQTTVSSCDTTNITYNTVIAPIIQTNCANCHSTSAARLSGGGIALDNYTSLKPYITNNMLMNSILQNGVVLAMPLNAPKINACSIKKISVWINNGALNN